MPFLPVYVYKANGSIVRAWEEVEGDKVVGYRGLKGGAVEVEPGEQISYVHRQLVEDPDAATHGRLPPARSSIAVQRAGGQDSVTVSADDVGALDPNAKGE